MYRCNCLFVLYDEKIKLSASGGEPWTLTYLPTTLGRQFLCLAYRVWYCFKFENKHDKFTIFIQFLEVLSYY